MRRSNRRVIVAWISAGLLVLAGVVTITVSSLTPVSFGWFAYQPLADATFSPVGDAMVVSRATAAGFVVLALGLLLVAFLIGWMVAKRHLRRGAQ